LLGIVINYFVILPPRFPDCEASTSGRWITPLSATIHLGLNVVVFFLALLKF